VLLFIFVRYKKTIAKMNLPSHIAPLAKDIKQVIQTHISYVLISDDEVLKFKKPVNFGFLDFENLADRKKYCKAEVKLNSRYSEGIYKGVVAVNVEGNRVEDLDSEKVVDYAVQMNAFEQEDVLVYIIKRDGEIEKDLLRELASNVAYAHLNNAPTSTYIQSFGTSGKINEGFNNNLGLASTFIGKTISQKQFDILHTYFNKFIEKNKGLLDDRSEKGFVKECHGDLHLANICIYQNRVQPFDCIEFNEEFRFIDTFYDIAFLLMDLDYRKAKDGSNVVLNQYLEITNDFEGIRLLNFYKSMRAVIRGSVTSLELNDQNISDKQKEKAIATAKEFYDLALSYLEPQTGKLYCTTGVSGSGKSYLARQLAQVNDAVIVRADAVRKHLCKVSLDEKSTSIYTDEISLQTYAKMKDLAKMMLSSGFDVILDATFSKKEYREMLKDLIPKYLECTAPKDVLVERLNNRVDIADADVTVMENQLLNYEGVTGATFVDTTKNIDLKKLL